MDANSNQKITFITPDDIINTNFRRVNEMFIHPDIRLNTVIYKYIKKDHFISMMQDSQLYVANRSSFSDRREKHWKDNKKMRFLFATAFPTQEEKEYYSILSKKIDESYKLCISCWTFDKHVGCDESIMNWKCYGENTYRIETTIEDLILSIKPTGISIVLSPVSYEKCEYDGSVYNALFKKHVSYQEEQELRMCLLSSNHHEILDIDTFRLIHKIRLSPFNSLTQNMEEKMLLENKFKQLSTLIELSHLYELK